MIPNILTKAKSQKGFTLIELLVVIAIIAILTVVFLPTIRGGQSKARNAAKIALINNISNALEDVINNGKLIPIEPRDVGEGTCVADYKTSPGSDIATLLGRVPQTFPADSNKLCKGGQLFYNWVSATSFTLAIELETPDGANVGEDKPLQGGVISATSLAQVITLTNAPVGHGTDGRYYYIVGRF